MKQKTVCRSFSIAGIGLHSGQRAKLTANPAPVNTGIVFIVNKEKVAATIDNLAETRRGTSLRGLAVVEHFLSAVNGLGLDNLLVEADGAELPSLDGSSLEYVNAIQAAGLVEQEAEREFVALAQPIKVSDGNSWLEARPFHGFKLAFMVNFEGLGEQSYSFNSATSDYAREIAPARTFGYLEEYEKLVAGGLGRGASGQNALVLTKNGYANEPRFPDEPVRHKVLDLIGDLALLGRPLHAEITAVRSGHKLNAELVRRIANG